MLIFIDTEYTGFAGPRLISLALVTQDGERELYLERNDFPIESCSEFVLNQVLPLLDQPASRQVPYAGLRTRLQQFFSALPAGAQLARDDARDESLLRSALGNDWPSGVAPIAYDLRPIMASPTFRQAQAAYHGEPGCPWHHALHDARALRHGWLAWNEERLAG